VSLDPYPAAFVIWFFVHALAAAMWLTLRLPRRVRFGVLTVVGSACFFSPLLLGTDPLGPLIFAAVTCPVMALKLIDLHVGAAWWRTQSPWLWVRYLPLPFVLVVRRHLEEPARPRVASLKLLARGLLEVAFGFWLLDRASAWHLADVSWVLEHTVRVLGLYAIAFDGGFVVVCASLRLLGINVMDFCRNPIAGRTPAEFWRRYNRPGGRFLYEDIFLPSGGRAAPLRGTVLVFAFNGLMHEALSYLFVREILGYQLLFFALHAVAVIVTFRMRPRGGWRVLAHVVSFVFVVATVFLFLANLDAIRPGSIFPDGSPLVRSAPLP